MKHREALFKLIKERSIFIAPSGQEFKLSSGAKSRVYCDLKKALLHAEAFLPLGLSVNSLAAVLNPEAVAGVAVGGCHIASASSFVLQVPTIIVRKEAKDHGTKSLVEHPDLREGTRVVLVEDVTTTAESVRKALKALQERFTVVGIIAVVDRRPEQTFAIDGVTFASIFRIHEFLTQAEQQMLEI